MTTPTEAPMFAPVFLRRYIDAGKRAQEERRKLEPEARALVLCGPECPEARPGVEHAHTYWDMLEMAGRAEYECELRRHRALKDAAPVDVALELRRAGVGSLHVERLRSLTSRPGQYGELHVTATMAAVVRAARAWWNQKRPLLPPDDYGNPASEGALPLPWLVLLGAAGTWKTQAAVECMAAYLRRVGPRLAATHERTVPPALFFEAPALLTLSTFDVAGLETVTQLKRTPFLVLDDVSKVAREKGGTHALGVLWDVLNVRYRERRYTVLTDNSTGEEFQRRMDFAGIAPPEDGGRGPLWRRCKELGFIVQAGTQKTRLWVGEREVPSKQEQP